VSRASAAMLSAAVLAMPALGAGEGGGVVRETTQTCSCTVCGQPVCCKAPTGFAPLDEKCKPLCHEEKWTVAGGTACAPKPDCCPPTSAQQ
jgi:hypothetical protein